MSCIANQIKPIMQFISETRYEQVVEKVAFTSRPLVFSDVSKAGRSGFNPPIHRVSMRSYRSHK